MARTSKGGTIFQRPECAIWYGNYVDADGKRHKVSTGRTDPEEARTVLETLMQAEREARAGRYGEKRARILLAEVLERTEGIKMVHHTTRQFLTGFLEAKKKNRALGGYQRYEVVIRKFLESLGKRADLGLERVTHEDIQNFINASQEKGKRFKTISFEKKALATAFTKAVRLGYLDANPVANVEVPAAAESVEKKVFTPHDVSALLAQADDEWKGLIALAYFAGIRIQDGSLMKCGNFDLEADSISFVPLKTSHAARRRGQRPKPLILPIHKELKPYISKLAQGKNPDDYLFPGLAGKQTSGRSGLSQQFIKLMDTAGVDSGKQTIPEDVKKIGSGRSRPRALREKTFHSLRHTFITTLRGEGVDIETRQDLAGHEDEEMTKHYTHVDIEVLRRAVDRLAPLPKHHLLDSP